ncbi:MAG: hypothetical protein EXS09_12675 [Gemmataceae bacterium]|nr:hypothetical protein [Gemmataceae bacterium]
MLESLRLDLPTFTLKSVFDEVQSWWTTGRSCFEQLQRKMKLQSAEKPVLDRLYPKPIPIPSG